MKILMLPVLTLLVGGCAHASGDQLAHRASFDLNCAEKQLQVVELDARTRGVSGCGQKVTYVETCDGPRQNFGTKCTWALQFKREPGAVTTGFWGPTRTTCEPRSS